MILITTSIGLSLGKMILIKSNIENSLAAVGSAFDKINFENSLTAVDSENFSLVLMYRCKQYLPILDCIKVLTAFS
jgi:hypothetical protein